MSATPPQALVQHNRFVLTASVLQVQTLRYTPAGIPALNLLLEHASQVIEMQMPREVKLQIRAVAFGALAESLARLGLDTVCEFQGFLGLARNGKGIVFHIQAFSLA